MLSGMEMLLTLEKLFLRINSNVTMVHLMQHLSPHYCTVVLHAFQRNAIIILCIC